MMMRYAVFCLMLLFGSPLFSYSITPINGITNYQFIGAYTRVLAIYDAPLFSGPIDIYQVAFYSFGVLPPMTPSAVDMYLGVTSVDSADRSGVFADNITNGELLEFSGPTTATSSLRGYTIVLPLMSPFHYDPAAGNLLLDLKNPTDGYMFPYGIAGAYPPGAVGGLILDDVGTITGALTPLIELSTPEPRVSALCLVGFLALLLYSARSIDLFRCVKMMTYAENRASATERHR